MQHVLCNSDLPLRALATVSQVYEDCCSGNCNLMNLSGAAGSNIRISHQLPRWARLQGLLDTVVS